MQNDILSIVQYNRATGLFKIDYFPDAIALGIFQANLIESEPGSEIVFNSFFVNPDKKKVSKPDIRKIIIPSKSDTITNVIANFSDEIIIDVNYSVSFSKSSNFPVTAVVTDLDDTDIEVQMYKSLDTTFPVRIQQYITSGNYYKLLFYNSDSNELLYTLNFRAMSLE